MHETISISYGNLSAEIDVLIAPLILEMWKQGITTIFSCENYSNISCEESGWANITFDKHEFFIKFFEKIMFSFNKSLIESASPYLKLNNHAGIHPYPCFSWEYRLYPVYKNSKTELIYSIFFPSNNISVITKMLSGTISSAEINSIAIIATERPDFRI